MLREKEESKPATHEEHVSSHTSNSVDSQRRHMLERRRKLEVLLKRNPGLRTLLKRVLEKRKIQELKKSQSDAQNCIPGLFYCRDESENEEAGRRREILKKIMNAKREDSSKYCPPGFFYCPKSGNDESERKAGNEKEEFLKEMFPKRFTQRGQSTKEMQDLDSIVKLSKKQREYHPRHKAEQHNVEFVREPASVRKVDEADESTKGKRTHHGDKLADDLMKSLQDTDKVNKWDIINTIHTYIDLQIQIDRVIVGQTKLQKSRCKHKHTDKIRKADRQTNKQEERK